MNFIRIYLLQSRIFAQNIFMKIAVIGTGYVGLVSGVCFAETGNNVICVDIDESKVERLTQGDVVIFEPGLDILLDKNLKAGRIKFTTNLKEAVEFADIIFLALPTPPGEDGSADLSYVLQSAEEIGGLMNEYKVIVDKSTVPVGTSELVKNALAKSANHPYDVVANPEFLREGSAVEDFLRPERIVIGVTGERAKEKMIHLYKPFVMNSDQLVIMDEKSAEITKYAANAFLATKITFMNEVANLCDKVGANVDLVRIGMGKDSRIGNQFLFPGIGYGGSCFPKDVKALNKTAQDFDYPFPLLKSVMKVNEDQKLVLFKKITNYFGDVKGKTFAIWGLAFKPNTDDIREASALTLIDALTSAGANVKAYDPEAMENVKRTIGDKITYGKTAYDILQNADALIIATEWAEFKNPDLEKIKTLLSQPVVFDGRNIFSLKDMKQNGFYYESIGRPIVK